MLIVAEYFAGDLQSLIAGAKRSKLRSFSEDEFEKLEAVLLNFGHTIGHAMKTPPATLLPHGEAVSSA
jgi:3-dehydroquinate synthetase